MMERLLIRENSYNLEKVCLESVEKIQNIQNEKKELQSTYSSMNLRTTKKVSILDMPMRKVQDCIMPRQDIIILV